jgi:hypothetical protein
MMGSIRRVATTACVAMSVVAAPLLVSPTAIAHAGGWRNRLARAVRDSVNR